MNTLEIGFFPFAALMVSAALFAVYRWVLRLKSSSRWAQVYIAVAVVLTTLCSVLTPVRVVEGNSTLPTNTTVIEAKPEVASERVTMPATAALDERVMESAMADRGEAVVTDVAHLTDDSEDGAQPLLADAWPLVGRLYLLGMGGVLLWFVCQLIWLCWLCRRYEHHEEQGVAVYSTDTMAPFSFGRNVFLPRQFDAVVRHYVLLHERLHITHRHFLQLCLLQLFVALNWYNPFVWLFFGEMRLQQELQVDADVLRSGVDRQQYQLSLLSVCTQEGRWILLRQTFGMKPLKQRIIFMNKPMNKTSMRRRQLLAAASTLLVMTAAIVMGCQTREKTSENVPSTERHHPMRGCWTMDWISNTGSGEEVHPVAMHYGFYNDSTFLCFSYWSKTGMNIRFSISGEGYSWHGDTLVCADGTPTDYTFPDKQTAISRWMKDSTQMAGVKGPDITEQWSRIKPNEDIVAIFQAALKAQPNSERPADGVWESEAAEGRGNHYLLVNDTVVMRLHIHPSTVTTGFRYGGSGTSVIVHRQADGSYLMFNGEPAGITTDDNDHLTLSSAKSSEQYRRITLPAYVQRAIAPAATIMDEM